MWPPITVIYRLLSFQEEYLTWPRVILFPVTVGLAGFKTNDNEFLVPWLQLPFCLLIVFVLVFGVCTDKASHTRCLTQGVSHKVSHTRCLTQGVSHKVSHTRCLTLSLDFASPTIFNNHYIDVCACVYWTWFMSSVCPILVAWDHQM